MLYTTTFGHFKDFFPPFFSCSFGLCIEWDHWEWKQRRASEAAACTKSEWLQSVAESDTQTCFKAAMTGLKSLEDGGWADCWRLTHAHCWTKGTIYVWFPPTDLDERIELFEDVVWSKYGWFTCCIINGTVHTVSSNEKWVKDIFEDVACIECGWLTYVIEMTVPPPPKKTPTTKKCKQKQKWMTGNIIHLGTHCKN